MSDNLIKRLREYGSTDRPEAPNTDSFSLLYEAADEIERLTAELSEYDDLQLCDCCEGLFESVTSGDHNQCESCTQVATLEQQNTRLLNSFTKGFEAGHRCAYHHSDACLEAALTEVEK